MQKQKVLNENGIEQWIDLSVLPKCNAGILNQTGTDAPVLSMLKDDISIPDNPAIWERTGTGVFHLNAPRDENNAVIPIFPAGRTLCFLQNSNSIGSRVNLQNLPDYIEIEILDNGGVDVDGQIVDASFKIEVYPE